MALIDARVEPGSGHTRMFMADLLTHWARCPQCAAAGPWEPWQTEAEYAGYALRQQIIGLGKPRGPHAVPLREQIDRLALVLGLRQPESLGPPRPRRYRRRCASCRRVEVFPGERTRGPGSAGVLGPDGLCPECRGSAPVAAAAR